MRTVRHGTMLALLILAQTIGMTQWIGQMACGRGLLPAFLGLAWASTSSHTLFLRYSTWRWWTYIATDSIELVAKNLAAHSEGLVPVRDLYNWTRKVCLPRCSNFHEITGKIEDVVLLHPLMMPSASHNTTRPIRFITNPPVSLKSLWVFKTG